MSYSNRSLVYILVLCSVYIHLIIGDDKTPSNSTQVIAPHCSDKCGNVTIPYPFGIEDGCFYDQHIENYNSSFLIHCNHSTNPPTPYFGGGGFHVSDISVVDGEVRTINHVSADCYNQNGYVNGTEVSFRLQTFTLSRSKNLLVAIGCDTVSAFSGTRGGKKYKTGCITKCVEPGDVIDGDCNGVGCCQASIPDGISNIIIKLQGRNTNSLAYRFSPCNVAFTIAKDAFRFYRANLSHELEFYKKHDTVPIVLSWTITGQGNCSTAKANGSLLCGENAECYDPKHEVGYRCNCTHGFSGNPYLRRGCQDINECQSGAHDCEKEKYCVNTIGSFYCKCPKGYHGNGTLNDHCVSNAEPWLVPVLATAGVGGGIIILLVIGFLLHWKHEKMQLQKMRDSFFLQNGGMLLHEKLSERRVDTLDIFNTKDLEVASNNYSDENIIGRGGFGVVYKGVLANKQVVAIKKSLRVDPNQVEQFINEIIVLSQIKNKYVVKLLGCCLESEVPLLVYEFINNGTLYEHLNDGIKASILKWPVRLKIALQVANVLSYLHDTIATPIIHRDMKSMNILLDESYTAKVTDFGASRLTPPDQGQLATIVLGTRGYLDPEYLQTSELTEKSDVYSFGVVLVELLTRKKAISFDRPEVEKCLAMHFLLKIKEGRLLDILDKNIVSETTVDEIQKVANLAKCCLKLKGEERPTMKQVAMELETIKRKGSHPWNNHHESLQEDCESLLAEVQRSDDYGGCSSGIESNVYDSEMLSSLEIGR